MSRAYVELLDLRDFCETAKVVSLNHSEGNFYSSLQIPVNQTFSTLFILGPLDRHCHNMVNDSLQLSKVPGRWRLLFGMSA